MKTKKRIRRGRRNSFKKSLKRSMNGRYKRSLRRRRSLKKRLSKKKYNQSGGRVELIQTILETMLLPNKKVEYLPTSNIFLRNNGISIYTNMITLKRFQELINENPMFKKSPTVQKIFNYNSEKIEDPSNIELDYTNISCDDFLSGEDQTEISNLLQELFFYLYNTDLF